MKIIFPFFDILTSCFVLIYQNITYNTLINLMPLKSYKKTATHFFLLEFERIMEVETRIRNM